MNCSETHAYRPDLEPPPPRIARLPVHRGYPVPWFVAWIDGVPEFRAMDAKKLRRAVVDRLCWVCGEPLGSFKTFVIGPMCGINRVSAEPPSHLDCARYAARNCPFLKNPRMSRREDAVTALCSPMPGVAIMRNPGVTLLWTTRTFNPFREGDGVLFALGEPEGVEWYAEGRPATRSQVEASIQSGLPALVELAAQDGIDAMAELDRMRRRLTPFLPKEVPHEGS